MKDVFCIILGLILFLGPIIAVIVLISKVIKKRAKKRILRNKEKLLGEANELDFDRSLVKYYDLPIRGMKYRELKKKDYGTYIGHIAHEVNNPEDKYAVGVYNPSNVLLGYVPKEHNKGICLFLLRFHDGKIKARIRTSHEAYSDYYTGFVKIALNMDMEGVEDLKQWQSMVSRYRDKDTITMEQ